MAIDRPFERLMSVLAAGERPARGLRSFALDTLVGADVTEAFAFFADAENLERLTPPWVNFHIRSPRPVAMQEGAIIDYRITIRGIPMPWRTRIDVWEPGRRFVDQQIAGPYQWWRHEHIFEPHAHGTRVIDRVEYVPRLRALSAPLVHRDVARIFAFRQRALVDLFDGRSATAGAGDRVTRS